MLGGRREQMSTRSLMDYLWVKCIWFYICNTCGDTMRNKSAVETAVNAITWVHELAGYSSISNIPIVTATLKSLQCSLAKPVSREEPITPDMLRAIVESLLHFYVMTTWQNYDVVIWISSLMLHITSTKTDQFCEGAECYCSSHWATYLPSEYHGIEIFILHMLIDFCCITLCACMCFVWKHVCMCIMHVRLCDSCVTSYACVEWDVIFDTPVMWYVNIICMYGVYVFHLIFMWYLFNEKYHNKILYFNGEIASNISFLIFREV